MRRCRASRQLQSTLGLARAVLVNASCHGRDNTVIVDAIAQSGGQYRGVANADDCFSERDFEKLHAQGFRGVRFNFVKHLGGMPDMDEFQRVLARIRPLGWHVDLHFDAVDLLEFDRLLQSLPLPFIIDHMGRVPTAKGLEQPPFRRCSISRAATSSAGSRSAVRNAYPAPDRRSPTRCRSHRR